MRYAKFAIIVFVLYFLGYVLGPTITPMLVKDQKPESSQLVKKVTIQGGATYSIDLAAYRPDDLPEFVKIEKPTELPTNSGEGSKKLSRGTKVKLLGREGNELSIETTDGIANGRVSIETTDLFRVLAQAKLEKDAQKIAGTPTPPQPKPPVEPTPPENPSPPVAKVDPPVVTPPTTPSDTGRQMEPTGVAVTEDSAPTADLGNTKLTADEIVALMKKFIAGGTLKEFKADQVVTWKAAEEEENIDGVNYQIGLVTYKAQTIFGEKPVNAKALIKGGEIDRWVFAKSGMEMR